MNDKLADFSQTSRLYHSPIAIVAFLCTHTRTYTLQYRKRSQRYAFFPSHENVTLPPKFGSILNVQYTVKFHSQWTGADYMSSKRKWVSRQSKRKRNQSSQILRFTIVSQTTIYIYYIIITLYIAMAHYKKLILASASHCVLYIMFWTWFFLCVLNLMLPPKKEIKIEGRCA